MYLNILYFPHKKKLLPYIYKGTHDKFYVFILMFISFLNTFMKLDIILIYGYFHLKVYVLYLHMEVLCLVTSFQLF